MCWTEILRLTHEAGVHTAIETCGYAPLRVIEAVEPYNPYGVDKAQKLGLKVYSAPRPPASYGPETVRRLQARTRKKVRLA